MALQQVVRLVQNDGNFSEIDLQDLTLGGPLLRIEMFRASHPAGPFGVTASGTPAAYMTGVDQLTSNSNRVLRNVFSVSGADGQHVKIELREEFDSTGALEVRARDLDGDSPTYGHIIHMTAQPMANHIFALSYTILRPPSPVQSVRIQSPLSDSMSALSGLADLGSPLASLGQVDMSLSGNPTAGNLSWVASKADVNSFFASLEQSLQNSPTYGGFLDNFVLLEKMGNFRDKTIHPGTNLTGPNIRMASEAVGSRSYRSSLIMAGRIVDRDMTYQVRTDQSLLSATSPLSVDSKPGVYSVFAQAYFLNNELYQLGLDKVHSDYGGIPMTVRPGSRLETGITPIVDSSRLNQSLAQLAYAFYMRPTFPGLAPLVAVGVI